MTTITKDHERYPEDIYTACGWMADELKIDMWEDLADEEDGGRVVFVIAPNGNSRRLSPAHCFDELTAMIAARNSIS